MRAIRLSLLIIILECAASSAALAVDKGEPKTLTRANWCQEELKACIEKIKKLCGESADPEDCLKTALPEQTKVCEKSYGTDSGCISSENPE